MSGHSKWHNIQARKGKVDKLRSSLFTKFARAITVAAAHGGGDPETNFTLRLAIEKAKEVNVPKDNIERAIKRGTGELNEGASLEEVLYEGFGPAGVAFLVQAVTDNKTRTVSDVKNAFSKNGGSMGGPGSVQWQFNRLGVVRLSKEKKDQLGDKWPEFELALMDAGVDDIQESEYGVELYSAIDKLQSVLEVVEKYELEPEDSGLEWVAKETVKLGDDDSKKAERLYEALDELDDVESVFTNEA